MNDRILVFIPMYNCQKQIVRVIDQLRGDIQQYISEVIIVDNKSTDRSVEAAVQKLKEMETQIPIKVLRNKNNYGLGGSHKVAFQYAIDNKMDYVIVLHGDDQGNVSDFLPLLKRGEYKNYDCCLGARFMRGASLIGYSKVRVWGNYLFNWIFSKVVRKKIYDLGSGLNMYSMRTLQSDYYMKFPDTLYFNDCMILAYCYYKQKVLFYPITWREEDQVSNNKLIKFSMALLKMLRKYLADKDLYINSEMRTKIVDDYQAEFIYSNSKER